MTKMLMETLGVAVSYDLLGTVMREIGAFHGEVDSVDYTEDGVIVTCRLPRMQVDAL